MGEAERGHPGLAQLSLDAIAVGEACPEALLDQRILTAVDLDRNRVSDDPADQLFTRTLTRPSMCGITAVLSSGAPVSADAVRAGIAALDHRGPDGRGHWLSPDPSIALGHFGARVVLDQALTIAMSYVFLHEGLGITS